MAALAAGEHHRVVELVDDFGGQLRAAVHRHLRSFGRHDLVGRSDDVDYLVWTAALVVLDRAASWDPAGAMPWTWADKAIRSAIGQDIGHATLPFDDVDPYGDAPNAPPPPPPPPHAAGGDLPVAAGSDDGLAELRALGRYDDRFLLLVEALGIVGRARDRAAHVQYGVQKHLGDPSPALTVGREMGLRPDHVRQIDRRMRVRLQRLAQDDPRYGPLIGLGWFDPPHPALRRVA
jgi:hypothetical protein